MYNSGLYNGKRGPGKCTFMLTYTQIPIKIFFIEIQAVLTGGFCAISVKSTGHETTEL